VCDLLVQGLGDSSGDSVRVLLAKHVLPACSAAVHNSHNSQAPFDVEISLAVAPSSGPAGASSFNLTVVM
jgi:hypothetical protein